MSSQDNERLVSELAGAENVRQWFGEWPSFHDAEVISVCLARKGQSRVLLYPYYPEKPATVEFILEDITDVELSDFSAENVISNLGIEHAIDQNGDSVFRLVLSPCYGIAGRIDALALRVEIHPGKSPDGGSSW